MKIEIEAASVQTFMATPLKIQSNGMLLTMGSALIALGIDPWSLAGELAVASPRKSELRLTQLLEEIPDGLPNRCEIARQAIAPLRIQSVEGADLVIAVRLARRQPQVVGAFLCFVAVAMHAILQQISAFSGRPLPAVAGYGIVSLVFFGLSRRQGSLILRPLLAITVGVIAMIFTAIHLAG